MDISLEFDAAAQCGRLHLEKGDLASGKDLETAILTSLFTDRRARKDDALDDPSDPRGCWMDAIRGDFGSRLWELKRQKITDEIVQRAREYAEEALQWLVDDGVADGIKVTPYVDRAKGLIGLLVVVTKGASSRRYEFAWREYGI